MSSQQLPSLVVTDELLTATNSTNTTAQEVSASAPSAPPPPPPPPAESEAQNSLLSFWQDQLDEVQNMNTNSFKDQILPLARIKKIMKMDDDVKMISAEAPLLFAKAAQMFITELSLRAWVHTEDNKRRTLQRNDIATAITKFDQFDFLIDIVPREDLKPPRRATDETKPSNEGLQYFYSLPQSAQNAANQNNSQADTNQPANQVVLTQGGQVVQIGQAVNGDGGQQIIQLAQPQQQQQPQQVAGAAVATSNQQAANAVVNQQGENSTVLTPQLIQQLISSSGTSSSEIQSIQLTPDGQLQIIKLPANTSENL